MKSGKGRIVALIESLMASLCAMAPANYGLACNKAADATSLQTGVKQESIKIEDSATKLGYQKAESLVGNKTINVVGASVFVYKTVEDKKLHVDLPSLGICDKVTTELATDSQLLKLQWNFK
jgi:hypothetical protein